MQLKDQGDWQIQVGTIDHFLIRNLRKFSHFLLLLLTAQKARDLAIEHNFDIHPASSAVEPLPDQCSEAFQFHSVLDKDVERVIKGFSSNKAPGYDRVSARILKDSLPVILPSITSIMNYSFHTGTFAKA